MNRSSGFSLIEILIVVVLFLIITTLSIITLNPHRRQVKTDDAAGSVFAFMRQARIQAVTDLLLLYPYIGRRTNDPSIRRMTTTPYPYLVFYEPTETEIIIHAVRHAARDPSGMPGAA